MWYGDAGQIQYTNDPTVGKSVENLKMKGNIFYQFNDSIYRADATDMKQYDSSAHGCKVINDPKYRLGRVCYALGKDENNNFIPVSEMIK